MRGPVPRRGTGCSFCAESIRKAYERTEGVDGADVSLAHEEVRVELTH